MKRLFPLMLKYFAVVGISCFLAYAISQTVALAATPAVRNIVASDYEAPGAFPIHTLLASWSDASRSREVPVKLYFPAIVSGENVAAKFPVILFSHGLGGNRDGGKTWAQHWASHGYVVVAIQHAGSDESLWRGVLARDFADKMKVGMTIQNLLLRIGDVRFVIDEIVRRGDGGEVAFANVDSKKIGMSGHSFGGQTTFAVAGQKSPYANAIPTLESRISAAIAFSPNARNKSNLARQFGDITMPIFSITGSEDGSILGDGTKPADRRLPYENMPADIKYLAVFDGGDHMVFGGHGFGPRRPETLRDKKIQLNVMAGSLAFWNAHLRQDKVAKSWLDEGGYRATLTEKDIFEHKLRTE